MSELRDSNLFPALPASVPRKSSSIARGVYRFLFKLSGWRITGEIPNLPKLVVIAAPHSSWWDGVWGLLLKLALGIDVRFMAKKELFFWPLGKLLQNLGGIPTDRSAAHGVVADTAAEFAKADRLWLAIAPEGTRKKVLKWKTGFWHIARDADVPILPLYFHYPAKTIGLGPVFYPSENISADMRRIRTFYLPWQGKYHDTV